MRARKAYRRPQSRREARRALPVQCPLPQQYHPREAARRMGCDLRSRFPFPCQTNLNTEGEESEEGEWVPGSSLSDPRRISLKNAPFAYTYANYAPPRKLELRSVCVHVCKLRLPDVLSYQAFKNPFPSFLSLVLANIKIFYDEHAKGGPFRNRSLHTCTQTERFWKVGPGRCR